MVALVVANAWSRPGWEYEWDGALSWTASGAILLGPLVAGLVAHERARRHAPTLTLIERTTARGTLAALSLPVAVFLLAMGAWLLGAGGVAAWVAAHDPVGRPTPTILAEVAVVLLAAAFLGAAIGAWIGNRAAGPIAAMAVYGLFFIAPEFALGGIMEAGSPMGTMAGVRRAPGWLAGLVVIHLAIAVAAAMITVAGAALGRVVRGLLLTGAVAVLVIGVFGFSLAKQGEPFQRVVEEPLCLGQAPMVCGPPKARPVLGIAEEGLHRAYVELADSGLPLRQRYDMNHGSDAFSAGAGDLSVDPSTFEDGAISRDDIAVTISVPTMCAAFFGDDPPEDLMNAQSKVMSWIIARLEATGEDEAPAEVLSAYRLLLDCSSTLQGRR